MSHETHRIQPIQYATRQVEKFQYNNVLCTQNFALTNELYEQYSAVITQHQGHPYLMPAVAQSLHKSGAIMTGPNAYIATPWNPYINSTHAEHDYDDAGKCIEQRSYKIESPTDGSWEKQLQYRVIYDHTKGEALVQHYFLKDMVPTIQVYKSGFYPTQQTKDKHGIQQISERAMRLSIFFGKSIHAASLQQTKDGLCVVDIQGADIPQQENIEFVNTHMDEILSGKEMKHALLASFQQSFILAQKTFPMVTTEEFINPAHAVHPLFAMTK